MSSLNNTISNEKSSNNNNNNNSNLTDHSSIIRVGSRKSEVKRKFFSPLIYIFNFSEFVEDCG